MISTIKRWVDALYQGTWQTPDGRAFEASELDLRFFRDRAKDFFRRRVPLPVALEPRSTVGLSHHERLAEQTRNTVGHCHDVQIGPDGQLRFLVDGTAEDLDELARGKVVRPEIRVGAIDTRTGHRFVGPSIVHLSICPRTSAVPIRLSASTAKPIELAMLKEPLSMSGAYHASTYASRSQKRDGREAKASEELVNLIRGGPLGAAKSCVRLGAAGAEADGEVIPEVMNKLTGGRWEEWKMEQGGHDNA